MPPGTRYFLEVNPRIPKRLARLEELANNLWYSWDRPTRALFAKLNPALWDAVGTQPEGDAEAHRRAAPDRRRRRSGVPRQPDARAGGVRRLPCRAAVQAERGRRAARGPGRLFLRRVRLPREPADLFRRPRHPRRRPLQGGERHPAAVRRGRPALPPGLLHADHRRRRPAARRVLRLGLRGPADRAGEAQGRTRPRGRARDAGAPARA